MKKRELKQAITGLNRAYIDVLRERTGMPKRSKADVVLQNCGISTFKRLLKANPALAWTPAEK